MGALSRIVSKPVQKFSESPLRRICATAPIDGFELMVARCGGDFSRFFPGAMIAPQVIIVDWFELFVNRNHAGPSSVESDGFDCPALDCRILDGLPHGLGKRSHVIGVALRGVVRIFPLAMQWILGDA